MAVFPDHHQRLKKDPGLIGASLDLIPEQIADAWAQMKNFHLPVAWRKPKAVVVCGMGGSQLGASIIQSVLYREFPAPLVIVSGYELPAWVDRKTLVVCTSYSGQTEEVLVAARAAKKLGARLVAIATGGRLATWARSNKIPLAIYRPKYNPSTQPRLAIAYDLVVTLKVLSAAGLCRYALADMVASFSAARDATRRYGRKTLADINLAKQLAVKMYDRRPLIIGAEWAVGNIQAWRNQIHENAKTDAVTAELPDLNHHLLEGLRHRGLTRQMSVMIVDDQEYYPRNRQRLQITAKIIKKLGAQITIIRPRGKTRWMKVVDLMALGGYVSWYLSILNNVNPAPIPTVVAIKKMLRR